MNRHRALLWLLAESPLPPSVGARLRALSLAQRQRPTLRHHGLRHGRTAAGARRAPARHRLARRRRLPSRREQLAALPRLLSAGAPPYLRFFCAPAQRRAVAALLSQRRFDAVVTQLPYCSMACHGRGRCR